MINGALLCFFRLGDCVWSSERQARLAQGLVVPASAACERLRCQATADPDCAIPRNPGF
jgi:hypothetical protein